MKYTEKELLDDLRDRREILDCLTRYTRGVDRCDAELAKSAYHSDALDDHGSLFIGNGHAFIEDLVVSIRKRWAATQHHITNHHVELDGDTAHAETYYIFVGRAADNSTQIHFGRYVDRLEHRAGQWKIAARVCTYEAGPTPELTAMGLASQTNGVRGREDVSYQRPLQAGGGGR